MATADLLSRDVTKMPVRRWTLDEYHRMAQMGFLTEDDKVELLEGFIVPKMAHNPPHDSTVTKLTRLLLRLVGDEWSVRCQCAVTLRAGRGSEPEPDITVARGPDERYERRHPRAADVPLVIEVSDSTIAHDRENKLPIYARARIPIYWIVNLVDMYVEVHTEPRGGRLAAYQRRLDLSADQALPVVLFGDQVGELPIAQFLRS